MKRYNFERPMITKDAQGNEYVAWDNVGYVWAEIIAQKGVNRVAEKLVGQEVDLEICDGQKAGVQAGWRLVGENKAYTLREVRSQGRYGLWAKAWEERS